MSKKNLVGAIKLPSSNNVFGHDDGTYETNTLVALLREGLKRKLKPTDKVIIIEEYLPAGVCDNPGFGNLKDRKSTITYEELVNLYEKQFHQKYSSEAEKERKSLDLGLELEYNKRKNLCF